MGVDSITMDVISIGDVIRKRRVELHVTQEDLCFGICDPSTFSKIESGKRKPSSYTLEALLQRLGIDDRKYRALVNPEDFIMDEFMYEIKIANANGEYAKSLSFIKKMEELSQAKKPLIRQFILRSKAVAGYFSNERLIPYTTEQKLQIYRQAIKITCPDYEDRRADKLLLDVEEVYCIMDIAICYNRLGQISKAISLYEKLMKYLENPMFSKSSVAKLVPIITYNYSCLLSDNRKYKRGFEIVQKGLEVSSYFGHFDLWGELIVNKAGMLYDTGHIEEAKNSFIEAYFVLRAQQKEEKCNIVLKYIEERYGTVTYTLPLSSSGKMLNI